MDFKELVKYCKNQNILYVEDDEDTLAQTSKMLLNYFNTVDTAINGEDGFDKFYTHKYDMIFTDISMPHLNGLEMIEKIRAQNSTIPIAIFSAYDDSKYFLRAIELGIDGYILKPYNIAQLNKLIEKLISKNNQITEDIYLEGGFIWDSNAKIISHQESNTTHKLTSKEILLIEYLVLHKNSIVQIRDLEEYLYDDILDSTKRIRNLISRLKSKLNFDIIESIYGYGYKLKTFEK